MGVDPNATPIYGSKTPLSSGFCFFVVQLMESCAIAFVEVLTLLGNSTGMWALVGMPA
jgi:hypothetical protein